MTPVAHHYEVPTHIMLSASSVHAAVPTATTVVEARPLEIMDPDERRWQLEWSRRNVED
jgi:hypothetical protein